MHALHGIELSAPGFPPALPPPGPPAGQSRARARTRLAGRERRRCAKLLGAALAQGALRLGRATRRRLADLAPVAEEVTLHWPHTGLSAAAALVSAGNGEVSGHVAGWMLQHACLLPESVADGAVLSLPAPHALLRLGTGGVAAVLAQCGAAAERLELRISEVGLLEPTTEQLLALSALRDCGVRLALEDFGMRHGSLALLRRLPLNSVHLDPGLTHDLSAGSEESGMVAGLVGVAHAVGLSVAARIGEESDRLEALRRLGVDEGVGG